MFQSDQTFIKNFKKDGDITDSWKLLIGKFHELYMVVSDPFTMIQYSSIYHERAYSEYL